MNKRKPYEPPRQAYVLRVNIADSNPKIWRKLRVPENYTLGDLHCVLQIAFGWDNDHMHSFTVNSTEYGAIDFDGEVWAIDEETVCLGQLNLRQKQKFRYLYDFGDSWLHEITVSKIIPIDPEYEGLMLPFCLDGERAGPLEDCGGIWGYERLLEIIKDPNHEEYEDYEWASDLDPEYISMDEINEELENAFKPIPKKAKAVKNE
jgi:hypothetical protein